MAYQIFVPLPPREFLLPPKPRSCSSNSRTWRRDRRVLVQPSSCSSEHWKEVDCGSGMVVRLCVGSDGGMCDSDGDDRGSVSALEEVRVEY